MQKTCIITTLTIHDNMKNNFITNYADHADFRDCTKNNFTSDYANYVDLETT